MTLPRTLTLVRHGESEGNVASWQSEAGNHTHYTPEFLARHSSSWRLTPRGIEQAKAAGEWLRQNNSSTFDRYYTSEYLRAVETAAHLGLVDTRWQVDFRLRERDYGFMDVLSQTDREERYHHYLDQFARHRFYSVLPEGETVAQMTTRLDIWMEREFRTMHGDERVIVVSHGGVMRSLRVIIESLTGYEYDRQESSGMECYKMRNAHILEYSRVNPDNSADVCPHFKWTRSVCPWDLNRLSSAWREITPSTYSNDALLELATRQSPQR